MGEVKVVQPALIKAMLMLGLDSTTIAVPIPPGACTVDAGKISTVLFH